MREEKDELKNQMKKLNEIDNEQAPPESDENSNPTNEEEEEIDIDKELDEKGFM